MSIILLTYREHSPWELIISSDKRLMLTYLRGIFYIYIICLSYAVILVRCVFVVKSKDKNSRSSAHSGTFTFRHNALSKLLRIDYTSSCSATTATTFDNSVSLNVERWTLNVALSCQYQFNPNAVVTTAAMRPRHDCDSTVARLPCVKRKSVA